MKEREFPNTPAAVGDARRFTAEVLAGVDTAITEVAVLMVSELATNSVRHAASEFRVAIDRRTDEIRISVTDAGRGRPKMRAPASTEPSGRGLRIVEAFADSWGISEPSDRPGKTVWFNLSLRAPESGADGERAAGRRDAEPAGGREPSPVRRRSTGSGGDALRNAVRHHARCRRRAFVATAV